MLLTGTKINASGRILWEASLILMRGSFFILLLSFVGAACQNEPRFFDSFPILTNNYSGALMVAASLNDEETPKQMVIDTLSPITSMDLESERDSPSKATRIKSSLTIYGLCDPSNPIHDDLCEMSMPNPTPNQTPPRLVYQSEPLIAAHTCTDSQNDQEEQTGAPCKIGTEDDRGDRTMNFEGVLGGDRLAKTSLRMSVSEGNIRLFPSTPGTNSERVQTCDAVFTNPFQGGGTWSIDGTEIQYGKIRPTFEACADYEDNPVDGSGVDLQMVFSSAIGDIILTKPAYERYVIFAQENPNPDQSLPLSYEDLTPSTVYLPSGKIDARQGTINRLALVDRTNEESDSRGPCLELFAHRLIAGSICAPNTEQPCPCLENKSFCQVGAAVEVNKELIVHVVENSLPLIQSLRDELRPAVAEIDGIFGTRTIENITLDLDYPKDRVLASCNSAMDTNCVTRPAIRTRNERDNFIKDCLNLN